MDKQSMCMCLGWVGAGGCDQRTATVTVAAMTGCWPPQGGALAQSIGDVLPDPPMPAPLSATLPSEALGVGHRG